MPFTKNALLRDILADPAASRVLELHIPGFATWNDWSLAPLATLDEVSHWARGVGEQSPDLNALWQDMADVESSPAVVSADRAPMPAIWGDREAGGHERASAQVPAIPSEQWGVAEVALAGPSTGNPFTEIELEATFRSGSDAVRVGGFYDGEGTYRIRFMPPHAGTWQFVVKSNSDELNGAVGSVEATAPAGGNHGPVGIRGTFHFAYADGTPYLPFGTTAYAWTNQSTELQEKTLRTLAESPFTKIRMGVFPKSYSYNTNEPESFAFERHPDGSWDFSRFNPAFFRNLEQRIEGLRALGIEADLILFHPYDRWGFSAMPAWADDLYLRYIVRRLGAARNVWWSLANEYDFMNTKNEQDWERFASIVGQEDHVGHLLSIHNGASFYDYSRPWVTHCSVQRTDNYLSAENTDTWRERWGKPVLVDEVGYEGDVAEGWGNLSPQELVRRCWEGAVRGGYVTHGETYLDADDVIWWAKGGSLKGESPERIGFLRRLVAEAPSARWDPLPGDWDSRTGGDQDHRVIYLGIGRPRFRSVLVPPGDSWHVDVIDTWNMTITTLPEPVEGRVIVHLPGREYMAIRVRRATSTTN
ncbi:DUF5605 domain-containing protein [Arthrobacter oryzae]|uniref:DUF5605 domain-containing protein n=1 Tax=Arthrobacter oryzae TaxID=409290 RepID=UPI002781CB49|nr:DUF5605 domain-containing protein [Arthrobacter oryzae]MDQ0078601.1 ribosomal protein S19 [Arthrobacter oryzae]